MKTFLTLTELESILDANGGKSVFELPKSPKRDLALEARILDTYLVSGPKGRISRVRYKYDRTPADTEKYDAYVSYFELYFKSVGYDGVETAAAAYWVQNPPLSTQTV